MWRRFLLLLLCVLIPLKAVMATECDCPHAAEMMGWMVLDASPQHEVHHHHDHGAASHGTTKMGPITLTTIALAPWAGCCLLH